MRDTWEDRLERLSVQEGRHETLLRSNAAFLARFKLHDASTNITMQLRSALKHSTQVV
jgi:hypothetical protein